ncbi:hypothetical protein ZWY2020_051201 [Hordeum vulgare]|nr:hypothetical protein ZWY2020_051201 [Hordeum vulgare]
MHTSPSHPPPPREGSPPPFLPPFCVVPVRLYRRIGTDERTRSCWRSCVASSVRPAGLDLRDPGSDPPGSVAPARFRVPHGFRELGSLLKGEPATDKYHLRNRRTACSLYGGGGGSLGTIAAIVTSLGGGPAAVGFVRLSGADAVAVVARVFRPTRKSPAP